MPLGLAVKCTAAPASAGSVSRWIVTPSIAAAGGAADAASAPATRSGTTRRTDATIPPRAVLAGVGEHFTAPYVRLNIEAKVTP